MTTLKKFIVTPVALALFALISLNPTSAFAQGPMLMVGYTPIVVTQNGTAATPNVTLATVRLSAASSTEDINVSRLPVTLGVGSGATPSNLSSCRAINLSNNSTLTTGSNVPSSMLIGSNSMMFDSSLRIPAGSYVDVAIQCNILASNAVGNTYFVTVDPASVTATSALSGTPVIATMGEGVPTPAVSIITTGSSTSGGVIVPGLPNTGAGGSASTSAALLFASVALLGAGVVYTRKFAR